MNQSLNILRKDAAQMLPQLSVPLFTLALFTVLEAKSWGSGPPLLLSTAGLTNVLVLLFCMTWVVLIISLVQAERLVGLNQFWTTRPYEWPRLFAAKCYFLLAFLYFPLLVSQVILLHQARLSIVHSVPALFYNLLLFTAVFVLPVLCAAAVTRSIGQAMLVLLVLLSMLVRVAIVSDAVQRDGPAQSSPFADRPDCSRSLDGTHQPISQPHDPALPIPAHCCSRTSAAAASNRARDIARSPRIRAAH